MARRSPSKGELKSAKAEFVAVKESYTSMKDSLEKEDEERQFFSTHVQGRRWEIGLSECSRFIK